MYGPSKQLRRRRPLDPRGSRASSLLHTEEKTLLSAPFLLLTSARAHTRSTSHTHAHTPRDPMAAEAGLDEDLGDQRQLNIKSKDGQVGRALPAACARAGCCGCEEAGTVEHKVFAGCGRDARGACDRWRLRRRVPPRFSVGVLWGGLGAWAGHGIWSFVRPGATQRAPLRGICPALTVAARLRRC